MSLKRSDSVEYFSNEVNPSGDSEFDVPESSVENFNDLSISDAAISTNPNLLQAHYTESNISQDGVGGQDNSMYDLIYNLVKLKRLLDKKNESVDELRKMNDMVEYQTSENPFQISTEFQQRYATLILHLDELNQKLKPHIQVVVHYISEPQFPVYNYGEVYNSQYPYEVVYVSEPGSQYPCTECQDSTSTNPDNVAVKFGMSDISAVTNWRRQCEDEAYDIVSKLKATHSPQAIDESKFHLIAKLTTVLTLLSHLQENRINSSELSCIEETFSDIRQLLHPCNIKCFEQSIEQLVSHIIYQISPSILPSMSSSVVYSSNSSVTNPHASDVTYPN
nr:protein lin 9 [Hymenolepis microstoma]